MPVPGSGRVLLESGANLDVSGNPDTELPMAANLLTVTLAGNELADDPEQQDGPLFGTSVTVDMRDSGTDGETGEPGRHAARQSRELCQPGPTR